MVAGRILGFYQVRRSHVRRSHVRSQGVIDRGSRSQGEIKVLFNRFKIIMIYAGLTFL